MPSDRKDSPADFLRFLRGLGLGMHGISNEELERQREMWARQQSPFAQDQDRAQRSYYEALRGMGGNFGQGVAPPPSMWCDHGERRADCLECKVAAEDVEKEKARQQAEIAESEAFEARRRGILTLIGFVVLVVVWVASLVWGPQSPPVPLEGGWP